MKRTVADHAGRWRVRLDPPRVTTELALVAQAKNTVVLQNVAVGDVYLCSGQSNMQFGLSGARDGTDEVAHALYPNIRLLAIPQKVGSD